MKVVVLREYGDVASEAATCSLDTRSILHARLEIGLGQCPPCDVSTPPHHAHCHPAGHVTNTRKTCSHAICCPMSSRMITLKCGVWNRLMEWYNLPPDSGAHVAASCSKDSASRAGCNRDHLGKVS